MGYTMSSFLVRTATRPGHTTRLSNRRILRNSSCISEVRDMWRYIAASAALCLVTFLCMVLTGPSVGPCHRRLIISYDQKDTLRARLQRGDLKDFSDDEIRTTLRDDSRFD